MNTLNNFTGNRFKSLNDKSDMPNEFQLHGPIRLFPAAKLAKMHARAFVKPNKLRGGDTGLPHRSRADWPMYQCSMARGPLLKLVLGGS
jgi:hypothetical protein